MAWNERRLRLATGRPRSRRHGPHSTSRSRALDPLGQDEDPLAPTGSHIMAQSITTEARRTQTLAPAIAASKSYDYFTPKRQGREITPRSRTETVSRSGCQTTPV
ncbi:MAG: hypothetical protein CTY20_05650 [Hyphomicrobium sp.]|nr:MAG: hypothetical protein CTY20_05650 [Hyphomicrobium sp.]